MTALPELPSRCIAYIRIYDIEYPIIEWHAHENNKLLAVSPSDITDFLKGRKMFIVHLRGARDFPEQLCCLHVDKSSVAGNRHAFIASIAKKLTIGSGPEYLKDRVCGEIIFLSQN